MEQRDDAELAELAALLRNATLLTPDWAALLTAPLILAISASGSPPDV